MSASVRRKDETRTLSRGGPLWGNSDHLVDGRPFAPRAQTTVGSADVHRIQNAAGLQLLVAPEHTSPVLRVVLPGRPTSDRSIEILFPEHVTVVKQGQRSAQQLYMFRPEGVVTDRCGAAPMALSNTSVTSETVSICSREPRWRATACASAMSHKRVTGGA